MLDHDRVTGVIDWSLATLAEPEFDVGCTRMLVAYAPISGGIASGLLSLFQRLVLARRYLGRYSRLRGVDRDRVSYYEAFRCLRALAWAGENTRVPAGGRRSPWDAPAVQKRLAQRFRHVSGVPVSLP